MFDVYWDRDCVCGGYETDDRAINVVNKIIECNNGEILAAGNDDNNWWWIVRFYDANDFAEYECVSVRKNCKENS